MRRCFIGIRGEFAWRRFFSWPVIAAACLIPCWLAAGGQLRAQATGSIEIDFREEKTDETLDCRVRILAPNGRAQRARGVLYEQGWNLVEGPLLFKARAGDYTYQAFHGPEFSAATGGFTLDRKSAGHDFVHLPRHAELSREGWFGGDLLSHVAPTDTQRWLSAEELSMAAVVSDRTDAPADLPPGQSETQSPRRWVDSRSYHDTREGSGLVLHHWMPPTEVPPWLPSSRLIVLAKDASREPEQLPVHVEIQRLWARDAPIWLASGRIDSIQVLSDHLTYDGERAAEFEPLIDPAADRFRGPRRLGRLVEYFYWQVLECGLRIPPSAGSGFGTTTSPLGYNRVYAHTMDAELSRAAWWQAVREGHSFVTSGPLLRATVNGQLPGHTFAAAADSAIEIEIVLKLTVSDPVEYLDVIYNGQTLYQARLDEHAKQAGRIPPQSIRESGWLLVRVVTECDHTYRIASTAPYYFQIGEESRISRSAVSFFQEWLEKSVAEMEALDAASRSAAIPYLAAARQFWQQRKAAANVE